MFDEQINAIRLELDIQQRSRQPEPLADVVDAVAHLLQRDAMFTANGRQNMQLTQVCEREKAIARVCRADHRLESSVALAGVTVALTEAPSIHRRCRQAKDACGFAGRVGWSVDDRDSRVFVFLSRWCVRFVRCEASTMSVGTGFGDGDRSTVRL